MHSEQDANVGALSVQLSDCQSSAQTLFTSYDIAILMKTRETYKKISYNWVPKHKFLKNQDFRSERNIT